MWRAAPAWAMRMLGRTRLIGAAVLLALVLLTWLKAPWTERLQLAWFDLHQVVAPRTVTALPVTVVEIDQRSLNALGQWPWPRSQLARLLDVIHRAGPAAVGINILMPETDALSPERLLAQTAVHDPAIVAALRAMPSNDAALARTLAGQPDVLVFAGTLDATGAPLRVVPIEVHGSGAKPALPLAVPQYAGVLTSIEQLDRHAAGWGLISVDTTRGVVRRMPLVAGVQGTLVPSLATEMLRVAYRVPTLALSVRGTAVRQVHIGNLALPTEPDGTVRVYFSPHRADRFVSAADVLGGKVEASQLQRQLVLVAPTAIGLDEYQDTPLGERLSGSEIQAQLLENLVEGSLLRRPRWASVAEALLLLVLGAMLVWVMPRMRPARATLVMLAAIVLPVLAAFALFRSQRLLFDVASPGLCLLLLWAVLLVLTLTETMRQRRTLQGVVQAQREQGARIAGEMAAAQRIQTGALPRPELLEGDGRIDLYATLTPAREVGGDLYDFYRLDADRLFLLIGDVAGKGLSASIFMAVSKALYKSAMLRTPNADIGEVMTVVNADVSRDNAEMLFVSVFAAILDLQSGALSYCNAGHDNPYRLPPALPEPGRISDGDGPPLCAVADYQYRGASCQLSPGEMLCLMTDGVTEAQNAAGELYGQPRAEQQLHASGRRGVSAFEMVCSLQTDVVAFAAGAEAADDLAILALRWLGPAAAPLV